MPDELVKLLRKHRETQERERAEADPGSWSDKGYVFTKPDGEPLIPNTDYHDAALLAAERATCHVCWLLVLSR